LHLALATLGLQPGDEVIIPDLTFVATANAVAYTGATPVSPTSTPIRFASDPASVKSLISKRTKAIIPVHLYGHPADMDALNEIGCSHGVDIIEDAAEGAWRAIQGPQGRRPRQCGVFSFTATRSYHGRRRHGDHRRSGVLPAARRLRDHAMSPQRRYFHEERGFNYRITNLQAALALRSWNASTIFSTAGRRS